MNYSRAQLLALDVENAVKAGKAINIPRHDTLNTLKRYLHRNKRKMAVSSAGLAVATILTGPVGLVIAVVGKAVSFGLTRAWRAARRYLSKSAIATFQDEMKDKGKSSGVLNDDNSVNSEYRTILSDVRYLCSHGGLTDTFNAFSELEKDYDACKKWEPVIKGTKLTSCKDAITMWEAISRVHLRFEALKPIFALIDDMMVYTTLELSRMEVEFQPTFRSWWKRFQMLTDSKKERVRILNTAANSDGVMHTTFSSLGREKDLTHWLRLALPAEARTELALVGPSLDLSPTKTDKALAVTADFATATVVDRATSTGTEFGKELVTSSISGDKLFEAFNPTTATNIASMGEAVVGTAAEKLNDYVNQRKYESKKTSIMGFYERSQTTRERVGTLRKLAKDNLEKYITKFEHWLDSDAEWKKEGRAVPERAAVFFLRRQKHQLQVEALAKFIGEFHHTVVLEANKMSLSVEKSREYAMKQIEYWLDHHGSGEVCDGYCYSSVLHGLRAVGVSGSQLGITVSNAETIEKKWDGAPCWRVNEAKSLLSTVLEKTGL